MSNKPKKRFFTNHAKSSAMVVSLAVHAALILVALSFVAVTVIQNAETKFEVKNVARPKVPIKKLQVPVKIKKKKMKKPKLRKRIVVQPKMKQNMPDIKMPEISGVKGGLGSAGGGGLGGAGGVGFSMPEFELFGVKGKGEKVFIILNASNDMMLDEMGGVEAYTIIKDELVRILEGLNPTVLFNIAIYGSGPSYTLFPDLVPASAANAAKVKRWIAPLNDYKEGMGEKDFGSDTKGPGGEKISKNNEIKPLKSDLGRWAGCAMVGMEQQADSIFVLSCNFGFYAYVIDDGTGWKESDWARWKGKVAEAEIEFKKANAERVAKGQKPKLLPSGNTARERALAEIYFPNAPTPPYPNFYVYEPKEFKEAFDNTRKKYKPKALSSSGLGSRSKKKEKYSINVIHFVPTTHEGGADPKFKKITSLTGGGYRQIQGLEEIKETIQ